MYRCLCKVFLIILLSSALKLQAQVTAYTQWNVGGRTFKAKNIDVRLVGDGYSRSGNTGEYGSYVFQNVPSGFTGTLYAEDPGDQSFQFTPLSVDIESSWNYRIRSNEINVGVSGEVLDGMTPLSMINIKGWLDNGGWVTTDTDANGDYTLYCPPYIEISAQPIDSQRDYYPENYHFTDIQTMQFDCDFNTQAFLTISGYVTTYGDQEPVPGVTITATGQTASAESDSSGFYEINVSMNFTGDILAEKSGYSFDPIKYSFVDLTQNQTGKDFIAIKEINISGRITRISSSTTSIKGVSVMGVKNVSVIVSNQDTVYTDEYGQFSTKVPQGWSGQITALKKNYIFKPEYRSYSNVEYDISNADFVAYYLFKVSGYVQIYKAGVEEAKVSASYDHPVNRTLILTTDRNGYYSYRAPESSDGNISVTMPGMQVLPKEIKIQKLQCDLEEQNFTVQTKLPVIAGRIKINNTGLDNVRLIFTDNAGVVKTCYSNQDGYYAIILRQGSLNGWSGQAVPKRKLFTFKPTQKSYSNVKDHRVHEDYIAESPYPTISGRVTYENFGIKNVRIDVNPAYLFTKNNIYTDADGYYNICLSTDRWSGEISPFYKDAYGNVYEWEPINYKFENLTTSHRDKDFFAKTTGVYMSGKVTERINQSNSPLPEVEIIFSDNVITTTDANGDYLRPLPLNWSGSATPRKEGYLFEPGSRSYPNLTDPVTGQDYEAFTSESVISGQVLDSRQRGVQGVTLIFAGDDGEIKSTITDIWGKYHKTVSFGWSGVVTPSKQDYYFEPSSRSYSEVIGSYQNQDYTAILPRDINVFTGTGYWTDSKRWSKRRPPFAGESAKISGNCRVNTSVPKLAFLEIGESSESFNLSALLNMRKNKLPDISIIQNHGIICTAYTDGMPFPANRKLGGEIRFDFNHDDPPSIGPNQVIPPGIYNKITLTGNKIVYVARDIAFVDHLVIEKGSRLGDPRGTGGCIEIKHYE